MFPGSGAMIVPCLAAVGRERDEDRGKRVDGDE
jgi:hypothetical protein